MRAFWNITVLGAILISGCQAPADDPGPSTGNGVLNAASDTPAAPPGGGTVFVQTFPEPDYPTPDTTTRGRFTVRGGCLSFASGGETYRAVLPAGSRFRAPDAVLLADGRRTELGREIEVKGGEGEFGAAADVPPACPQKAMLIGGLR